MIRDYLRAMTDSIAWTPNGSTTTSLGEKKERHPRQDLKHANKHGNSFQERVDMLSGVPYTELSDLMGHYQADRIWNECQLVTDKLEEFNTFVTKEILPRIKEKDERFDFDEVIPAGSFREQSVISQKTNWRNYIEHEFDFMLVLHGLGDDVEGISLVDCKLLDERKEVFKQIVVAGDPLKKWCNCCVEEDGNHFLDADKIMESFEKVVTTIMDDMMENEEGLVPGCITISRNGPAVTLQFDIAKLPLEMQSPYPEDWRGVTLRKAGYNCINNWSVDLVLCVSAGQAFNPYANWASRQRKWPTENVEKELCDTPTHLVAKSTDSIPHTWRLSTSLAEMVLADAISKHLPLVRNCWLVLKAILKAHLSQPKLITSYSLKTIIFFTVERISPDYWTELNLPELLLAAIDAVIIGLGTRSFPHYFLPGVNLLSKSASEDHIIGLLQKCCEVRAKPDMYLTTTPNFNTYLTDLL